jgi:glutathione S-transferase
MSDSSPDDVLRLVTIPFSHFCEKARWALDRFDLAYREEGHLPLAHYTATFRAGGRRTVPVLVTPTGTLADSTDILRWVDRRAPRSASLYPDDAAGRATVEALEDDFDRGLGPATRRVGYFHLLADPPAARRFVAASFGPAARVALRVAFPAMAALMRRGMRIDAAGAARSLARIESTFDAVEARLAGGARYLVDDRFTAADLTFAALAAPVLLPPEYGAPFPPLDEVPSSFRDLVARLRAHPAGVFARRVYRDHRAETIAGDVERGVARRARVGAATLRPGC